MFGRNPCGRICRRYGGVLRGRSVRKEPEYKGVTLSAWLMLYNPAESTEPSSVQAAEAVRAIGTNAVPFLVNWIGTEVPPWIWKVSFAMSQSRRFHQVGTNWRFLDDYVMRYNAPMSEVPILLVAVVDDKESVRIGLQRLLRSFGMEVETFACGQAFLDSVASRPPDCVLLDRELPGLSGLEVQQRISEARLDVPVIVVTGNDAPNARENAVRAGAADYLLKPIKSKTLVTAINAAVNLRAASCLK